MDKRFPLIVLHLVALLMACTAFTIVTAPLGRSHFTWSFFSYGYSNGWGYQYHSDYSLPQVLAYLVAYTSGVVLYPLLTCPLLLARLATIICLVGAVSFTVELSHWFFDHHVSVIASLPVLLLPIAAWTLVSPVGRKPRSVAA